MDVANQWHAGNDELQRLLARAIDLRMGGDRANICKNATAGHHVAMVVTR